MMKSARGAQTNAGARIVTKVPNQIWRRYLQEGLRSFLNNSPEMMMMTRKDSSSSCIWCLKNHLFMSNEMNRDVFVGEKTKLIFEERFICCCSLIWLHSWMHKCWKHGLKIHLEFCKVGVGFSRNYYIFDSSHSRLDWTEKSNIFLWLLFK